MDFLISSAYAQAAGQSQQSPFMSMIPIALIFVVMYFFMIRPQKKRMEEEQKFVNQLSNGQEVFTKSGILGKIAGMTDKLVTLEIAEGTKIKVLKSHLGGSSDSILNPPQKDK